MSPLAVLLLSASVFAVGQGDGSDDPAAMLRSHMTPLQNLAAARADDVKDPQAAAEWALWDLLEDLEKQRVAGADRPQPSAPLVDVYLRMVMRRRVDELKRFGSKPYPGDADFQWAAGEAAKDLRAYLGSVKSGEDVRFPRHRSAVEGGLVKALKRMISFRLRSGGGRAASEPPSGYAPGLESTYINKARMNKTGNSYSLPPWPGQK